MDVKNEHKNLELQQTEPAPEHSNNYSATEAWVDSYKHCELCGEDLIFTHITKFIEETVEEEAHCPSCNIQNKNSTHRLQ